MKENEFLDGVSNIEDDVVERFVSMDNELQKKAKKPRAKGIWMRVGAVAACFVLILSAVIVGTVLRGDDTGDVTLHSHGNASAHLKIMYLTFEELLSSATEFVNGTCIEADTTTDNLYDIYKFKVNEWIYGKGEDEIIELYVLRACCSVYGRHSLSYCYDTYNIGESYYLVMTCFEDPCSPRDHYSSVGCNLYIPVNNVRNSSIYGENLLKHSSGLNIFKMTDKKLKKYIYNIVSVNGAKRDTSLIKDSDVSTIIAKSPYVLVVKAESQLPEGIAHQSRDVFYCNVISALKGEAEEGSTHIIGLPKDRIEPGETFIVALFSSDGGSYRLSSRNSIYSIDELDNIKGLCGVPTD